MGQPGVACTAVVNWVRRNSRAVSSAVPILYIRRGEEDSALASYPPWWEGVRAQSVACEA